MIVAGGLVTLKPVGGLHTNSPSMQPNTQPSNFEQKQLDRQQKIDAMIDKLAQQNQQKKWTVPYK